MAGGAAATGGRGDSRGRTGRAAFRVERTRQAGGSYGERWGLRSRLPIKSRHPETASVSLFITYEAKAVSGPFCLMTTAAQAALFDVLITPARSFMIFCRICVQGE